MKTYAFRHGAHIKGDPQRVGESLDDLQRANGQRLTPRVVVDAARPDDSPLHDSFEWDDVRAGEMHREHQARQLIASVRVVVSGGDTEKLERVFVNVTETVGDDEQRGYVPIARVLSDADLYRQVLDTALRDISALERRYEQFADLTAITRGARQSIEQLTLEAQVS